MAQYTPNYGLSMPDVTDDFSDFSESYNENMEIIDNNLGGGSGSANQNIAENYDDTLTYSVGDYVIYNGLLYKCDTAVATAETFDPTKWTHVVVTDEMGSGGGSGGHTIVDENGSTMPTETALQFTGNVSVSDDNVNGRTVVDILGGGGSTFGFAIDENNKLFEGTINNFNQSLSYTATEDAIALCYFRGGVGTWQFLLVNGVMLRLGGDGTNTPVSYSIPIRKGDTVSARYQSGSESCYFWLSVYGIKQGTSGIFAPVIYSDTERKIGVWRDNKPLYQRTYDLGSEIAISNTSWQSLGISTSGFEMIPKCSGMASDGSFQSELLAWNISGTLYVQTPRNSTGYVQYITLQYTKTADTPGSGTWNTDGVPTIHYSTSEQVIGTWIDGKPLYEITLNPTVNRGSNTLNHGIANFKECIRIFGKCKYNNTAEVLPLPYVSTNTQYVIACGNVTPTTYLVDVGTGFTTIQDCYVTIQYTKTTD